MKIVLIQPPQNEIENDRLDLPLGLMYLSSILKQYGNNVSILDFSGGQEHAIPHSDIVGFSTYTPAYSWCLRKRDDIKTTYPDTLVIAGGPHVSALPDECSNDWDALLIGEAEGIISKVISGERGVIQGNVMDIDKIPFPDYSSVDINTYTRKLDGCKSLSVLSSRGCLYKCAFCNSIIMGCGQKVRVRHPQAIADEIQWLKTTFGINAFRFVDDLFTLTERRVEDVTKSLMPLGIKYRCNGKVNNFTKDMASLLKTSGCKHISFGVESGSDKILSLMNKKQTAEDSKTAIKLAKDAGLVVRCYLIVGFPGETWETVEETIQLMLTSKPDEILVFAPIPFPGTSLYRNREKYNITWMSDNFDDYMQIVKNRQSNYVFSHYTATAAEISEMRTYVLNKLSHIAWVS